MTESEKPWPGRARPHISLNVGKWWVHWNEAPVSFRTAIERTFEAACEIAAEWWAQGPRLPEKEGRQWPEI